ncbi:winged helix-turn-helix DNA-binding domain, Heat shock transcription factor family [Artemisia annua]|uniref:Winged helix-turn-helix DNA-binding domain, Heat shock transcription factor family n=1 Tax=Artemisia annua TaxID=35608 RepID=A0A2U1MB75_ARTAN|nr:winged helix-turn-helix DNA-binding domain, Heat shock transcription factor family [Artemisia annua]
MEGIDVDETTVVSDISEGFSSGNEGGDDEELLAEPIRGVRNGDLPLFVNKLYNMVCNKETDSIISWVPNVKGGRFIVLSEYLVDVIGNTWLMTVMPMLDNISARFPCMIKDQQHATSA